MCCYRRCSLPTQVPTCPSTVAPAQEQQAGKPSRGPAGLSPQWTTAREVRWVPRHPSPLSSPTEEQRHPTAANGSVSRPASRRRTASCSSKLPSAARRRATASSRPWARPRGGVRKVQAQIRRRRRQVEDGDCGAEGEGRGAGAGADAGRKSSEEEGPPGGVFRSRAGEGGGQARLGAPDRDGGSGGGGGGGRGGEGAAARAHGRLQR